MEPQRGKTERSIELDPAECRTLRTQETTCSTYIPITPRRSMLLGGSAGLRQALNAIDGIAQHDLPTARTLEACGGLLDLLKLEHVHDPSRIEAERFARLDPAWPVVEEICLLADGFNDVLDAYMDESEPHRVHSSQVAA